MQKTFDIDRIRNQRVSADQYQRQLRRLSERKIKTDKIEATVKAAIKNLQEKAPAPFIIYGEPQSGKTEMMICLSAKLLDVGFEFIVLLLNDSVDLLNQNLGRFQSSGLAPSPKNFSQILDPGYQLHGRKHVVFCKKNARDLEKLTDKIDSIKQVVIIDDEADYATPNSKINRQTRTKINELIEKLLTRNSKGRYIGVTATPARLDLNNTFNNSTSKWVEFAPHEDYTGQDHFFPANGRIVPYRLNILPAEYDAPRYSRRALFSFLVAAAYLNLLLPDHEMKNYSMLVHTSGQIDDHQRDSQTIQKAFARLADKGSKEYLKYAEEIWNIAQERYPAEDPYKIIKFILDRISRYSIIVLNSKKDVSVSGDDATNPKSLFTIIVGGNIVSRGVTLNNLLSMYFTRDVVNKIQQDTYIQRARMFGLRSNYLEHFELSITGRLYIDWHRCFVYHKLSLDGARNGNPPIWATDHRVSAVASASIDRANVYQTSQNESSFALFELPELQPFLSKDNLLSFEKLRALHDLLDDKAFPKHLLHFVEHFGLGASRIAFYAPQDISSSQSDPSRGDDIENVYRSRGFWGQFDRDKNSSAVHHFKIFHYKNLRGRLFYKYDCADIHQLRFLSNQKNG